MRMIDGSLDFYSGKGIGLETDVGTPRVIDNGSVNRRRPHRPHRRRPPHPRR